MDRQDRQHLIAQQAPPRKLPPVLSYRKLVYVGVVYYAVVLDTPLGEVQDVYSCCFKPLGWLDAEGKGWILNYGESR